MVHKIMSSSLYNYSKGLLKNRVPMGKLQGTEPVAPPKLKTNVSLLLEPMKVFMTMIYDDMVVKNGAGKEVHILESFPMVKQEGLDWTRP